MSEIIQRLLDAFTQAEDRETAATEARQVLQNDPPDFGELRRELQSGFDELDGGDLEQVTRMEAHASAIELVSEVEREQAEIASRRREAEGRFAAGQQNRPESASEGGGSGDGGSGSDGPGSGGDGDDGQADDPDEVGTEPIETGGAAGSGRQQSRVPLSGFSSSNLPERGNSGRRFTYQAAAAADLPGIPVGQPLTDMSQVADAIVRRMTGLQRLGPGKSSQAGIATIHRQAPDELTITSDHDTGAVDVAANERNLPGGNLVAAGGWCAPSETLYDMCPTAVVDGMVDIPEVVTNRGGIRFADVPSFSEVYSSTGGSGFWHTPEEVEPPGGGDPTWHKDCYEIPCPQMEDHRLGLTGVCIRTPILTERGWPELVSYLVEQVMVAHAHRINHIVLSRMSELATAVAVPPINSGDDTPHGTSATASLLSALELYVEHLRYKYRLGDAATMELIAPRWLRGILRADLSKRMGVDLLSVTNAMLNQHLQLRGTSPQWVVDWQDSLATGNADDMGGSTDPTAWPTAVSVLIYPAGTYIRGSADVITLDGVYDHAGLQENKYTSLFTEEGLMVYTRCYQPYQLDMLLCPNGETGGTGDTTCSFPAPSSAASIGPPLAQQETTGGQSGKSGSGSGQRRSS